jgi:hypothetical protein
MVKFSQSLQQELAMVIIELEAEQSTVSLAIPNDDFANLKPTIYA